MGLVVELCKCCGANFGGVNETPEGMAGFISTTISRRSSDTGDGPATPSNASILAVDSEDGFAEVTNLRNVPAHLREMCAEALVGAMKCLFRNNGTSRSIAEDSVTESKVPGAVDDEDDETPPEDLSKESPLRESNKSSQSPKTLRQIKVHKNHLRQAAHLFNKKSSKGIQYLVDVGMIPSPVTPHSVARFLRNGIVVG